MATVKLSRKKAHQVYKTKDGKTVVGASTICKVGEPIEHLLNWYHRLGIEGIDPKEVMAEAAGIGTVGHFMIHCHFNGDVGDFSDFSANEIAGGQLMYDKFLRVWSDQDLELVSSEIQLVSEKHGFGGTLDLVARRRKTGKLALADVKSSPNIYPSMILQLSGYEALWNETNEEPIGDRVIFRLDKKDPEKTDIRWLGNLDNHFTHFLNQLACYNSRKLI